MIVDAHKIYTQLVIGKRCDEMVVGAKTNEKGSGIVTAQLIEFRTAIMDVGGFQKRQCFLVQESIFPA